MLLPSNSCLLGLEDAGDAGEVEARCLRYLSRRETGRSRLLEGRLPRFPVLFELGARLLEIGLRAARCFPRFGFGVL